MATRGSETQLTLRIDLDADPITGSLSSAQVGHHRFSGWIGLAAALEIIRAQRKQEPTRNPPPPVTARGR